MAGNKGKRKLTRLGLRGGEKRQTLDLPRMVTVLPDPSEPKTGRLLLLNSPDKSEQLTHSTEDVHTLNPPSSTN